MHISGKILAGLIVALGLGATYLSARMMGVRQGWMEQAQKNQEEFEKKSQQLVDARAERDKKRAEYVRAIVGWERVYEGPDVTVGVDDNGLILIDGVGTTRGVKAGDVLYVFLLGQEPGASRFLSAVQVADAAEARASARPYTRIRAGEIQPTGQRVPARVRRLVPARYQVEAATLDQTLLLLEQSIDNAKQDANFLRELQDRTEVLIADRMKEIEGDPGLAGTNLPEVNKAGLLAAIASEEDLRNGALRVADDLLRRLLRTREKLDQVLASNRELVGRLPQTTAPQASARGPQR